MAHIRHSENEGNKVAAAPPRIPDNSLAHRVTASHPLLWTIAGTGLGFGLLYASTRKLDATALFDILRAAEWDWICVILSVTLAFCAIKAWRWRLLLRFAPGITFRELHSAVYVGLAVNFLIAHVGEILRAVTVARNSGLPASALFASVVIERVLDFIALLVLLTLIVSIVPDAPSTVTTAAVMSGGFVVLVVAGLYAILHPPAWSMRLAASLNNWLPSGLRLRFGQLLERFRTGLASLRSLRLMLLAIVVSVLQWTLVMTAIWCSGFAVTESVSLMAVTVTFVLIVVGLTLPNSPMQFGTTQMAFVIGLGTDGTGVTAAIAASLVYSAFLMIPIMLVGGILALRGQTVIKGLRRIREIAR